MSCVVLYRAYVLTFEEKVVRYEDFDCDTGDEAVWCAKELMGDCTVEVWLGPRRIAPIEGES